MDRKGNLVLKILGLIAILLIYISNRPATETISNGNIWMTDYMLAKNKAKVENKHILIFFSGSDWSRPSIELSRDVFEQEAFKSFAKENLILLRLDFPKHKKNLLNVEQAKHNKTLAEKFNNQGHFPLVLVIDKNENVLLRTEYKKDGASGFLAHVEKTLTAF